jgi:hypothetical protein
MKRSPEKEIELLGYEEEFKASLPRRHTAAGWFGFISWFAALIYVAGPKRLIKREYF